MLKSYLYTQYVVTATCFDLSSLSSWSYLTSVSICTDMYELLSTSKFVHFMDKYWCRSYEKFCV